MKCAYLGCGNEARYIDAYGRLCCGVCPIRGNVDATRISDVPQIVAWVRDVVNGHRQTGYSELDRSDIDAIAELIGPLPQPPKQDPGLSFVLWPMHQPRRVPRPGVICDMWTGPCSCGAWHREGE